MTQEVIDLTPVQEKELLVQLQALRGELEGRIQGLEEAIKPVDLDTPIGRLSRMDAMQEQQLQKATCQQHTLRLQQVNQALRAAENDVYGYCRKCEEPVGYARLRVRPEASFCMGCQSNIEKH